MPDDTHDKDTIEPGTVLDGRFRVDGVLGQGGFATVYRGLQLNIERQVAIKVLDPLAKGTRAKEVRRRFMQEAKIAAQLDHPSIVNVIDFGLVDDSEQPYIVMELLTGHDLGDEIRVNGPIRPSRLIPLFIDALEGLASGHRLGVVHKDLKPANLFLCHPGQDGERLSVLDFGVARLNDEEDDQKMTQTGHFLGTPQYLAPEYVNEQLVTPGIDVYQMGLIMVEALTGVALIEAATTMKCIVKSSLGAFSIPEAILSSCLGEVVSMALAFDPKARYPDGRAFAQALASVDLAAADTVDFKGTPTPTTERREHKLTPSALLAPTAHGATYEVDATAMTLGYETDSAILDRADLEESLPSGPESVPWEVPKSVLEPEPVASVGVDTDDVVWVAKERRGTLLRVLVGVVILAAAAWSLDRFSSSDREVRRVRAVVDAGITATKAEAPPSPVADAARTAVVVDAMPHADPSAPELAPAAGPKKPAGTPAAAPETGAKTRRVVKKRRTQRRRVRSAGAGGTPAKGPPKSRSFILK